MKKTKTIIAIVLSVTMLLMLLSGCAESNSNNAENILEEETVVLEDEEVEVDSFGVLMAIDINDETNFKYELINQIQISKEMSEEERKKYISDKILNLKEFYNLDNFMIDGYKLCNVGVDEAGFGFSYASIEKPETQDMFSNNNIEIVIGRTDYKDYSDPFSGVIEQAKSGGQEYIFENNMFYIKNDYVILVQMNDTIFRIDVPEEMASYEYLRDLAFQVIEKAEFVKVDGYVIPDDYKFQFPPVEEYEEFVFSTEPMPMPVYSD